MVNISRGQLSLLDMNDVTASTTAPISPIEGSLWFNTSPNENQLYIYSGGKWVLSTLGIEIGGRNLALDSKRGWSSSVYNVVQGILSEDWVVGETYTITVKGTVNSGQTFGIWRDTGSTVITTSMITNADKTIWTYTVVSLPSTTQTAYDKFSIYNVPSTGATQANIEWIKIEKGNKATDWTPAPEDVDAVIIDIQETLGNMANDNILDYQERSVIKDKLSNIIGYVPYDGNVIKANFENKVSGSTVENPHIGKNNYNGTQTALISPSSFTGEYASVDYGKIFSLNSDVVGTQTSTNLAIAQQLFSFNIIQAIERNVGTIPKTLLADKVQWAKDNVVTTGAKGSWYGFGSSVSGNKASFRYWASSSAVWSTVTPSHTNGTVTKLQISVGNIVSDMDANGFVHFLAYAEASNGTIVSRINTDYVELEITMKDDLPLPSILDSLNYGDFYNVRKKAINAGLLSTDGKYKLVETTYTDLKIYLESFTPIDAWDVSNANKDTTITVVKSDFRNKWLAYYNAVNDLATATTLKLKENVDNVQVGGRNYYKIATPVIKLAGTLSIVKGDVSTPNGFKVSNTATGGSIRVDNVLNSNGEWTVSFKARASIACSILIDIADNISSGLALTTVDQDFSYTLNVTNYSTVYDFFDMASMPIADYFFTDFKVEKGNKATDWSPSPEDVDNKTAPDAIASSLSVTPTAISLLSQNLVLTGNATFNALNNTVTPWKQAGKTTINGGQIETNTIGATSIKTSELIVGTNVTMGANAVISWGNVTSKPTIPNSTYIDANGVYTGTISANKITGGTITGVTLNGTTINSSGSLGSTSIVGDSISSSDQNGRDLKISSGLMQISDTYSSITTTITSGNMYFSVGNLTAGLSMSSNNLYLQSTIGSVVIGQSGQTTAIQGNLDLSNVIINWGINAPVAKFG
jgi:hypothetical protein